MKRFLSLSVVACSVGVSFAQNAPEDVKRLRAQGPQGLQTLMAQHQAAIAAHRANPQKPDAQWPRIERMLDEVAAQRDAWASGLYWYTDLEAAKRAAAEQKKPILSLRMLGKLSDEYSCANSRFFRTALYANKSVSQALRENFILHWKSERPVPIVTIDMGDGRVVKRTLTGNSAHYLLDATSRPLDALPGLYGPGAFARWLEGSRKLVADWNAQTPDTREAWLKSYHRARISTLAADYRGSFSIRADATTRDRLERDLLETPTSRVTAPTAEAAGARAMAKKMGEFPLLNVSALYNAPATREAHEEWEWSQTMRPADAQLDENSLVLMRTKTAQPIVATAPVAQSQTSESDSLLRASFSLFAPKSGPASWGPNARESTEPRDVVSSFQKALALDSARNEYRMHAPIHAWFAKGEAGADLEKLNARVYDELFLTPRSDPWLGLAPTGLYTALPGDGLQTK
ncbi:MAG TPA: hypothetical protein VF681_07910 [Abditibacteriaceae bacterium]|jgi:hypothetical protein